MGTVSAMACRLPTGKGLPVAGKSSGGPAEARGAGGEARDAEPRPRKASVRARPRSAATEVERFLAAAAATPKPTAVLERPAAEPMPMIAPRAQTMAEILRAYGHVSC